VFASVLHSNVKYHAGAYASKYTYSKCTDSAYYLPATYYVLARLVGNRDNSQLVYWDEHFPLRGNSPFVQSKVVVSMIAAKKKSLLV